MKRIKKSNIITNSRIMNLTGFHLIEELKAYKQFGMSEKIISLEISDAVSY